MKPTLILSLLKHYGWKITRMSPLRIQHPASKSQATNKAALLVIAQLWKLFQNNLLRQAAKAGALRTAREKREWAKKCPSCYGDGERRYQGEAAPDTCRECGGSGKRTDYNRIQREHRRHP